MGAEVQQTLTVTLPLQNSSTNLSVDVRLDSTHLLVRVLRNDGKIFTASIPKGGENSVDLQTLFVLLKEGKICLASDGERMKLIYMGLSLYSLIAELPGDNQQVQINLMKAELQQVKQELQKYETKLSNLQQAMVPIWQVVSLNEGWKSVDTVCFTKDFFGFVHIKGTVQSANENRILSTKLFTLPDGFQPTTEISFMVPDTFGQDSYSYFRILPNGIVMISPQSDGGRSNSVYMLHGLNFNAK